MIDGFSAFLVLFQGAVCAGIAWACICRLHSPMSKQYKLVRARYALLLMAAFALGFQPWLFGTMPSVSDAIFSSCVLIGMAFNALKWQRHNMPHSHDEDYL